jgi:hypothetical protein
MPKMERVGEDFLIFNTMKKVNLYLTLSILLIFKSYSFSQNMDIDEERQDNYFEKWDYQNVKKITLGKKYPRSISNEQLKNLAVEAEKEHSSNEKIADIMLKIYSLDNQNLAKLCRYSRELNGIKTDRIVEQMSDDFFKRVEGQFRENALLASLDENKNAKMMSVAKISFSKIFDTVVDYAECLLCCSKNNYPSKQLFLFKPKKGNSIKTQKADYSKWFSDKICGFNIYDFPCEIKKARINNLILLGLNGSPKFNNTSVHVATIPTIIVYGLSSLSTAPCENKELMEKVKNTVRIKCK